MFNIEEIELNKIHTKYNNFRKDFPNNILKSDSKYKLNSLKLFEEKINYLKNNFDNIIPIIISTEANGKHFIIDGHHRFYVAHLLEKKIIKCIIFDFPKLEFKFMTAALGQLSLFGLYVKKKFKIDLQLENLFSNHMKCVLNNN